MAERRRALHLPQPGAVCVFRVRRWGILGFPVASVRQTGCWYTCSLAKIRARSLGREVQALETVCMGFQGSPSAVAELRM